VPGFFTDGDPATGQAATLVTAEYLNSQMLEALAVLVANGITPNKATFNQLALAIQSQAANSAVDTGVANAYAVALSLAPTTPLPVGFPVRVKAAHANTGPSTLSVNGSVAVAIHHLDGSALQAGDIPAGGVVCVVWDGAAWQYLPPGLSAAAMQAQLGNYAVDTGAVNAVAVTLSPAPSALTAGLAIRVKVAAANTGPATLNVNGLGAVAIKYPGGAALAAGSLQAGGVYELVYDGAVFQMLAFVAGGGYQIISGNTTWTVPAGVTSVRVLCLSGAPGAGQGYPNSSYGSSSGNFAVGTFAVTPGQVISCTVGAGGLGGTNAGNATVGGTTSFGALLSVASGAISSPSGPGTGAALGGAPFVTTAGAIINTASLSLFTRLSISAGVAGFGGAPANYGGGGGAGGLILPGVVNPSGGTGTSGNIGGTNINPGTGGSGYGAGGGGGPNGSSYYGYGGNGAPGVIVVEW
jgi:hypothetical protein